MLKGSVFAMVLICVLSTLNAQEISAGSRKPESALRYDRIQILEGFFKAIYPDLADGLAMFELDVIFDGPRTRIGHLRFYPCVSGAGVSTGIEETRPLLPSNPPIPPAPARPPVPPQCGVDPTPESARFLNISLDLPAGPRRRPIAKFAASGTYVEAKLEELRKQFVGKWYPTHDEVLEALRAKSPKYGPEKQRDFLAAIPLDRIREITGCHLHPETAAFIAELTDNSLHLPPDMQWHLSGTAAGAKADGTCRAVFEPFDGRLTLFTD
jgi:hypothetical protein